MGMIGFETVPFWLTVWGNTGVGMAPSEDVAGAFGELATGALLTGELGEPADGPGVADVAAEEGATEAGTGF